MKCQRCFKPATLQVTEIHSEDEIEELRLCADCAKKHFDDSPTTPKPKPSADPDPVTAELESFDINPDVAGPGEKHCEVCQIKFVEFRNSGRLGCPEDYEAFREELVTLLESIHGDVRHQGKTPRRRPRGRVSDRELAQLRKKLQHAIKAEHYEEAAQLRDRIRDLESH